VFSIVSLAGAILIICGYGTPRHHNNHKTDPQEDISFMFLATVAFVASVGIPLIDAWTNITNKKMKGINDTTVTCYVNPSMLLVMGVII